MDPLDKEELKAFLQIIKKDMPIHTENNVKIKLSYSQDMPKNLMEYSQKIDNKFLNNNLHTIEEIEYRKKGITNDFKNYQNKYYDESGILNHDLYFEHENKIYSKIKGSGIIINPYNFSAPHVNGAEVETSGGGGATNNSSANMLDIGKASTFVANTWYDQCKLHISTASGNIRVGMYNNTAGTPTDLLGESSSLTAVADYTTIYPITEGLMLGTVGWIGHNSSSGSLQWAYWSTSTERYYKYPETFGVFQNPLSGATQQSNSATPRMKASHS